MFATASCKLKVLAETGARLTALTEPDGGVRLSQRDVRSDVWRREDYAIWEAVLVNFQCALSTWAGTDCVGHEVGAATGLLRMLAARGAPPVREVVVRSTFE